MKRSLHTSRLLVLSLLCAAASEAANPVAQLSADRAPSGKAPLLVYFEAHGTTDLDTPRPFHHLTYCFDAGDGNTEKYTIANASGRFADWPKAKFCGGPAFAYVYETPGTYEASVTAIDQDGNRSTARISISVGEFGANETVCVQDAAAPSAAGCPTGASLRTEGDPGYADVAQAVTTALSSPACGGGTRPCSQVLFQGGGRFTLAGGVRLDGDRLHVGAYGSGRFQLDVAGSAPTHFFSITGDDVRIGDFSLVVGARSEDDGALVSIAGDTNSDSDYILVRNAETSGTHYIASIPGTRQGEFEAFRLPNVVGFFELKSSDCGNSGANCYFTAVQKMAIVGSLISDSRDGEHLVRLNHAGEDADSTGGAFIYANRFEMAAPRKNALTARVGNIRCTVDKNWGGDFWGEQVIVANNHFEANSQSSVDIGQGNGCCLARRGCTGIEDLPKHRDNIVEGNFFTMRQSPDIFSVNVIAPRRLHIHQDLTIRNNVAILSPSNVRASLVRMAVENGEIHNNAIYGGSGIEDDQNIIENADSVGCSVLNNVAWGPRGAAVFEGPACGAQSANNWQKDAAGPGTNQLSSCPYAVCPPVTLDDFQIVTSDPDGLIDGGAAGPLQLDVRQRIRPSGLARDVGPHETGATALPPGLPVVLPPMLFP